MLANTYGIAMPARMDIEAQILAKQRRLPGLPSSRFGLDILTGDDTDELPPEADYYVRAPVADARGEAGAEGEDDGGKGTEGGAPRKEPGE